MTNAANITTADLYFTKRTKRDLATQREAFTAAEGERLRDLMARGPLAPKPEDKTLARRGWIEQYDGMNAVDTTANAAAAFPAIAHMLR